MSTNRKANRSRIFMGIIVSMLVIFSMVSQKQAQAATLIVNTLIDENDGTCSDGKWPRRVTPSRLLPLGIPTHFQCHRHDCLDFGSLLHQSKNLSINGPVNYSLTVDGNNTNRVFSTSRVDLRFYRD